MFWVNCAMRHDFPIFSKPTIAKWRVQLVKKVKPMKENEMREAKPGGFGGRSPREEAAVGRHVRPQAASCCMQDWP